MSPHETFFLANTQKVEITSKSYLDLTFTFSHQQQPQHPIPNKRFPRHQGALCLRRQRRHFPQSLWLLNLRYRRSRAGQRCFVQQTLRDHQSSTRGQSWHYICSFYSQSWLWHVFIRWIKVWDAKWNFVEYQRITAGIWDWVWSLGQCTDWVSLDEYLWFDYLLSAVEGYLKDATTSSIHHLTHGSVG